VWNCPWLPEGGEQGQLLSPSPRVGHGIEYSGLPSVHTVTGTVFPQPISVWVSCMVGEPCVPSSAPHFRFLPSLCYRRPPLAFLCRDALPWQPQPGAKETGERPLVRPACPWHGRVSWRSLLLGSSAVPQVLPYSEGFQCSGKHVTVPQGTFQSPRNSVWEDTDSTYSLSQLSYLLGT